MTAQQAGRQNGGEVVGMIGGHHCKTVARREPLTAQRFRQAIDEIVQGSECMARFGWCGAIHNRSVVTVGLQPIQNEFGEGFLHRGRLQLGTDNLGADDFAHIRMVAPTALNRGSGQSSTAQLETRTDTRGTLPNDGDGVNGANGGPQHDDPQDCIVQYLFR
jgi:hypothetical protein